eukprot:TRINITY_DN14325_c0_g1_i2.p1 TRINITY_DN14325_c0_g1~~TRINITY_DN14325_c0_g1_i2.p1  ORF type:complete len:593 (+),score=128.34 TRINITY_DN14325_c0_g1_i2:64-1842(+)
MCIRDREEGIKPFEDPAGEIENYTKKAYINMRLSLLVVLYIVQPSMLLVTLQFLSCIYIEGNYYMTVDPSVKCWTGSHFALVFIFALPTVIALAFVYPYIAYTYTKGKRFSRDDAEKKTARECNIFCIGYASDHVWWELFILVRKYALICFTVFVDRNSIAKATSIIFFICLYFFMQLMNDPFGKHELNITEALAVIVSLSTYFCLLYYHTDIGTSFKVVVFIFIVLANSAFLLMWMWKFFKEFITKWAEKRKEKNCIARHVFSYIEKKRVAKEKAEQASKTQTKLTVLNRLRKGTISNLKGPVMPTGGKMSAFLSGGRAVNLDSPKNGEQAKPTGGLGRLKQSLLAKKEARNAAMKGSIKERVEAQKALEEKLEREKEMKEKEKTSTESKEMLGPEKDSEKTGSKDIIEKEIDDKSKHESNKDNKGEPSVLINSPLPQAPESSSEDNNGKDKEGDSESKETMIRRGQPGKSTSETSHDNKANMQLISEKEVVLVLDNEPSKAKIDECKNSESGGTYSLDESNPNITEDQSAADGNMISKNKTVYGQIKFRPGNSNDKQYINLEKSVSEIHASILQISSLRQANVVYRSKHQ